MQPVRLAMIGTGLMGQRAHLEQYVSWPDCQVVALAEPRRDLAARVAARYGIPEIYHDHLDLLDHAAFDGLVCIQPYAHHRALLPDLYKAGKPILTEKPLALSVAAGAWLADMARSHGVTHMVGYHKRCDPAMEYARTVIRDWQSSGVSGRMTYLRVTMPPGEWTWNGFAATLGSSEAYPEMAVERADEIEGLTPDQARAYDGFVNYYIHQVNAIRYLLGEDYGVEYADASGRLLVGRSVSGVMVVLEMAPWQNTIDWQERCLACFERATVQVDLPAPLASQQAGRVELMIDNGQGLPRFERPMLPTISAMRNQARHFIDLVRGEGTAPCLADEAVRDLQVAYDYIRMRDGGSTR